MGSKTLCCALLIALTSCPYSFHPDESYRRAYDDFLKGNLAQAEKEAERGVRIWPAEEGADWHWRFLLLRARVMLQRGRSDSVPPLLEGFPADSALEIESRILVAHALMNGGHYEEANSLFERLQKQTIAPRFAALLPEVEVLKGLLSVKMSREQEAEATLRRAVEHSREQKNLFLEARALNNLGYLRMLGYRPDEAIPYFQQALELSESAGAVYFGEAARDNIGICYGLIGEFDKALAIRQRAIQSFEKLDANGALLDAIGELGNLYLDKGDPASAAIQFKRAFDLAQEIDEPSSACIWAVNLAAAYIQLQRWDEADVYNQKAASIATEIKDIDSLQFTDVNSAAISAARGQTRTAEALYEKLVCSYYLNAAVLWQAHADYGALAASQRQWPEARAQFESALQIVKRTRAELLYRDHRITFVARLIRLYQQYVEILVEKQGDTERALYVADSSRALTLTEGIGSDPSVSADGTPDYRKIAGKWGGVILSYWIAPRESYVWAITANEIKLFRLGPEQEIVQLADRYQAEIETQISDPLESNSAAGHKLYDLLVRPIAGLLHPDERVFVIPDGRLHNLNLETLLTPETHYWIEDATISIAPSLRMLASGPPPDTKSSNGLLLIGDPDSTDPDFPKLQYAKDELTAIQKQFSPDRCSVYSGPRATPDVYRHAVAKNFAMIHISAHAMANRQTPLDSAIILSNAGAESRLYARNITTLPLHANLVTLSACRSAGARAYAGEGMVGFSWAFLRAGAHNVVAGLWDVGDRSTAEFMGQFYGSLKEGQTPADALRDTKLSFLKRSSGFRKPYYWAPFQIYTSGGV